MTQTYRVRYRVRPCGQHQTAADVWTADVEADPDHIAGHLPPGVYIMYVEDLTAGRAVHWTRWPTSYRPGFGG